MRHLTSALAAVVFAACATGRPETTVPAPVAPTTPPPPSTPDAGKVEQTAPPPATAKATKVRMVEGITEYRLDNGLQVLLFPDSTQSTVTVNITYLVGSRLEGYGETGMAHLLEHMMFKGSPRHRNVLKLVEERGGWLNGSTYFDRTNYFETLPASAENLDWALDLEADRMTHASISDDDLKTEFSVVRNEFEKDENQPSRILNERVEESAYLWHAYGHPTIGSRADIERVPIPALRAFYAKYYQPDNAMLVVSGKFDDTAALALIEKYFGAVAKPSRQLSGSYTVEPAQDGERRVTMARTGDVSLVEPGYHGVSGASPDYAPLEAAIDILTREPSGRLYKKLVETKVAANQYGYSEAFHDPSLGVFVATVRDPKNVDQVEKTLETEIEGLATGKIDDKDLERWRVGTLRDIELAMADSTQIAIELSEWAAIGDWRTLFAHRDAISKVTVADVQRVAKTYFIKSNRTVGVFTPIKDPVRAPLTETADVAAFVKDVKTGTAAAATGEVFEATLDNIDKRTQRVELKGGVKAAFLDKKTRGGKVSLHLSLHWGDAKSLQNKGLLPAMVGTLMSRGTTKHTFQELEDKQNELKARISFGTQADGLDLYIETFADKLGPSLDLAAEMMTSPAFPAKELDIVKQNWLSYFEQQLKDPQSVADTTMAQLQNKWPKSDPRYSESPEESIAEIKAADIGKIQQFYKDFAGAGHGELVVVGEFDKEAVKAQVEKVVASWQTKKPYARLEQKAFLAAATSKAVDIKDKEQTTIEFGEDFSLKDSDPDYPALLMANQIFGGDAASRLWMRVREHEGLSYGVYSYVYAGALDDSGGFGAQAIVAPQNADKAKAAILEELQKINSTKVGDDELTRAKAAWIKEQDTALSNDGYVSGMLQRQLFTGRDMAWTKSMRDRVNKVTADDVLRAAKKYLTADRLIFVEAGDQAKKTAK